MQNSVIKLHQLAFYFLASVAALMTLGCEEPYVPSTTEEDQQYVIEGYIEYSDSSIPTYVMVTKSIPYITEVGPETFSEIFVSNARVVVNDGEKDVQLTRLCLNDPGIPDEVKQAAAAALGFTITAETPNICIYVDILSSITVKEGGVYGLEVTIDDYTMTAQTTIPTHVPLYDFHWEDPPGEPNDTLAQLWVNIDDPEGTDYYRYLTEVNNRGLVAPFQSVTDDAFFNGKEFDFPLSKAEYPQDDIDPNAFGLFTRGDSITLKWINLDEAHFKFWNTRDYAASSGGPFSSYTRIAGNIEGGLGIWGGMSASVYRLYCPPK